MTHSRSTRLILWSLVSVAALAITAPILTATDSPPRKDPSTVEFFEREIRPLLVEKCQTCHSEKKVRGGLRLTGRAVAMKGGDRGPALVPGKPEESLLIKAVAYTGD